MKVRSARLELLDTLRKQIKELPQLSSEHLLTLVDVYEELVLCERAGIPVDVNDYVRRASRATQMALEASAGDETTGFILALVRIPTIVDQPLEADPNDSSLHPALLAGEDGPVLTALIDLYPLGTPVEKGHILQTVLVADKQVACQWLRWKLDEVRKECDLGFWRATWRQ